MFSTKKNKKKGSIHIKLGTSLCISIVSQAHKKQKEVQQYCNDK